MEPQASQPAEPSDSVLVRQAQAGDGQAYGELIRRYQRRAVAVSFRLLGHSHDALEVTQDAFMKGFRSLGTLQNPDAFAGWMLRIVSNLSLNYRRSRKSRSAMPLDELVISEPPTQTSGDPLRAMESRELGEGLQKALAQLPEKQRLAIVLFTIEELPQKEVAEAMDCSVEAVKWYVFQGRKKLKTLLAEHL